MQIEKITVWSVSPFVIYLTGYCWKSAIDRNSSILKVANKIFTPPEEEVIKAKRILKAMEEAQKQGKGAASLDGRLIDLASVRQAEVMMQKSELIKK